MPPNGVARVAECAGKLSNSWQVAKAVLTLDEEREWAWDAKGADLRAEGPKGTKAASSEASASLGTLVGRDASLRAASVTLMKSRGQPSKLCLLQAHLCCHGALLAMALTLPAGVTNSATLAVSLGDGGQQCGLFPIAGMATPLA